MQVEFARRARELLEAAGFEVEYHESDGGHYIEPEHIRMAAEWISTTLHADQQTPR